MPLFSFPMYNCKLDSKVFPVPESLSSVICPTCFSKTSTCYRRNSVWISIFLVPILPIRRYRPYLSCSLCENSLTPSEKDSDISTCPICTNVVPCKFVYCTKCGCRIR